MERVTLVSSLEQLGNQESNCQQVHLNAVIQAARQFSESYHNDSTEQNFACINYTGLLSEFNPVALLQGKKPKTEVYFTSQYAGLTSLVGILYPTGVFERRSPVAVSCYRSVTLCCEETRCYDRDQGFTPIPIRQSCGQCGYECSNSKYGDAVSCTVGCYYYWSFGVYRGCKIIHHGGSDPHDDVYYVYCTSIYYVKEGIQRVDLSNACVSIYKKFQIQ